MPPGQIITVGNHEQESAAQVAVLKPTLFLLGNLLVPQDGILIGFSAYFMSTQQIEFQIWRPTMNNSDNFGKKWFSLIFRCQYYPSAPKQVLAVSAHYRSKYMLTLKKKLERAK